MIAGADERTALNACRSRLARPRARHDAAYVEALQRLFEAHLERARRFVWSLSVRPERDAGVRIVVFGGDCSLTPARLLVEEVGAESMVRLYPGDIVHEKLFLFTPRMFNPTEFAALATEVDRVVATGRPYVFIDIGANVGLFSIFVAARAKGGARILAFEPEIGNFERLAFNVWNSGGGIAPGGPFQGLRMPAYEGSQRGRVT